MNDGKSITLTLGSEQQVLDDLLASGEYGSASDAVKAALRALEREREMQDELLLGEIQDALDDPRPSIPAADVFAELRSLHADHMRAAKRSSR